MDVNELVGLSLWMDEHLKPAMSAYEQLVTSMEQNANSGSKVPLREYMEAVQSAFLAMPVEELSYEQMDLLDAMQVGDLIGGSGWKFIERSVKEGNYDPASAAVDVRKAKQSLEKALEKFNNVIQSLASVGIVGEPDYENSDKVTVRVRFKGAVEIGNISELKKWSAEWYDIARGLAMTAGESPEDVEIKGATTGSLILVLGTSLTVATIISLIMKQIASTVKSSMEIAHTLQDWKMRKVADAEVERVLIARRKSVEENGIGDAIELVKKNINKELSGDVGNALDNSIKKMFNFSAKGGEVDILPPPNYLSEEEGNVSGEIKIISDNVKEMRVLKAETQLLIEDSASDEAEGDGADVPGF